MNKKVKPTLFIGLGSAGKSIVEQNIALLKERNPLLLNIITDIVIAEDGKCASLTEERDHFELPLDDDIIEKGIFAKNFNILLDNEEKTYDLIRTALSSINQYDKRRPLIEQEFDLGEPQIILCASVHEPMGSAIIIPLLKQVYAIKQEVNYLYSEVTTIFLLPDLFHNISGESGFKIISDYKRNEQIPPLLKDSARADSSEISYQPISAIGRKPVVFLKGENDSHKIAINDIDQGAIGDCYFLALLGGLGHTNPGYIEQMVVDNLDNTYTVRFHEEDGSEKQITIDNKFWVNQDGIPIYSKIGDYDAQYIETWVMLVEKAWAKWHQGYEHIEGDNRKKDDYAMALTGHRRQYIELNEQTDEKGFFTKLYETLYEKKLPVTFNSKAAKEEGDDPLVVENHAYILKEVSFQDGEVNLYNPYGHNHLYNCDFEYLKHHFIGITFFEVKPFEQAISNRYKTIRDLEYCRSLATINELDAELDKSEKKGISLINYPFFVGSKNSKNITLGSFSEMLISLSEFSLMLINEGFATNNLGIQMGEDSQGKMARYSSLGFSSLIFPQDKVMTGLKSIGKMEILDELQHAFRNEKFTANSLSAEVKSFLSEKGFTNYLGRMQKESDDGKPIFDSFQYTGDRSEEVDIRTFISNLDKQGEEYEAKVFNKTIVQQIESRQKVLTQKLCDDISQKIEGEIGKGDKNINFAHGFTSMMVREDCDAIVGEILDDVKDLRSLEYEILDFYRSRTDLPKLIQENDEQYKLLRNKERQLIKLKNDTQRLTEKINAEKVAEESGAKSTTADRTSLEVELKSREEEQIRIATEVEQLTKDYQSKKGGIEKLKLELESPEYRKQLRESDLAEQQERLDVHLQSVVSKEQERRQTLSVYEELNKKKDKLLKKLLILLPTLVFGIPAVVIAVLEFRKGKELGVLLRESDTNRFEVYGSLFVLILLVYGIWAFLNYRKKVGKALKETRVELKDINQQKGALLSDHIKMRGETYKLRFDHLLHSSAYGGVEKIIRKTEEYKSQLESFKKSVIEEYGEARTMSDELQFDNNLFQSSVLTKEDVLRLNEKQTLAQFLREKEGRSLPNYYNTFVADGDLGKLENDIGEHLEDIYRPVAKRSVSDFIYRDAAINKAINAGTRFRLLTDASEVYINLKDYGTGDHTEETANLYVNQIDDPDSDETYRLITSAGLNAKSKQSTGDKNTISIFRAKKGFPAFQMTIMDECRAIMENLTGPSGEENWSKGDFYVKPDYLQHDVFPTTLTLGNTSDEVRIAFARGRALGIIEDGTESYYFDNKELGKTVAECIKYLKSLKGEGTKEKLIQKIDILLNGIRTSDDQKMVLNQVKSFIETHPTLDATERTILGNLMRSFV